MRRKAVIFIVTTWFAITCLLFSDTVPDWGQGEQVCAGIVHLRIERTVPGADGQPMPLKGNILRIDLTTPGLRFTSTGRDADWGAVMPDHFPAQGQPAFRIRTRRQTTPKFLKECRKRGMDMRVAFNSCPWQPWEWPHLHRYAEPRGVNISDGVVVSENDRTKAHLVIWRSGQIDLMETIPPEKFSDIWLAASGFDIILRDGQPTAACNTTIGSTPNPRTAVGLSADRRYLYVLTIDGRQPKWSRGATYNDLNTTFLEFDVTDAINLDGGGSTTLCCWKPETAKNVVLSHATTQNDVCRPVAMSIGVFFEHP